MPADIATLKRQLQQLRELHEAAALPQAQYEESKALLERRIVDAVLNQDEPGSIVASAAASAALAPATAAPAPAAGVAEVAVAPSVAAAKIGVSRKFQFALVAGVLFVAVAGYLWKGSPQFLQVGPGAQPVAANGGASGAATSTHSTESEQIAAMVERLAQRMKDQPQDAEGWAMLARSYTVLVRHADALPAYEKAVALRGDDAQLLADYADSLAVKNGRSLAGEPMKWVNKALQLEPRNLKALALAGTEAFVRKDYPAAVKHWEQVAQFAPPDSNYAQQIKGGLEEARQLAGMPAKATANPATVTTPAAPGAPAKPQLAGAATVSGAVSIAAALATKAGPEDTVFVFARKANGERMPLAVLRKKVRDLPFEFTLDDSMAMSPAAKLSDAKDVVISARISKTGEALPSSGDLSGQLGPVAVGSKGVKLEIKDTLP
jgi:cytochrome c-type biogenesis protein CcmH